MASTCCPPNRKIHQQQSSNLSQAETNSDCLSMPAAENKMDHQSHQREKRTGKAKSRYGIMSIHVTEETLTDHQKKCIEELRQRLGKDLLESIPIFNDTFSLLRWLIGWNYKIDDIVPRFEKAGKTIKNMGAMDMVIEDIDELNIFLSKLTSAADYFPGGVMGYDDDGNVVTLDSLGRCLPKTLAKCGRVSDVYRLCIFQTALLYQLLKIQERKLKRKLGLRVIIDMAEFNSEHMYLPTLKTYGNLLAQLQFMFPDLMRQVYVVNAPFMVTAAYKIINPILSEQSREKVLFFGTDYQKTLARDLGASNLFKKWGGDKIPARGDQHSAFLRVGGPPPLDIRYNPEKNPLHTPDDKLTKLVIPARAKRQVHIECPSPGHKLHWFFLSNGEIDFSVNHSEEEGGEEIWPLLRLSTFFVPEYGSIDCNKEGGYTLVFDNSVSSIFSREVKYRVWIEEK